MVAELVAELAQVIGDQILVRIRRDTRQCGPARARAARLHRRRRADAGQAPRRSGSPASRAGPMLARATRLAARSVTTASAPLIPCPMVAGVVLVAICEHSYGLHAKAAHEAASCDHLAAIACVPARATGPHHMRSEVRPGAAGRPRTRIRCRIRCSGRSRRTARRPTCSAPCTSASIANSRLPDLVWKKLDDARAFAMETDLDSPASPTSCVTDGGSLHADLGDAYWKKLEDALGADDRAAQSISMKPMVPATLCRCAACRRRWRWTWRAVEPRQERHKPIVFLEPVEREAGRDARQVDGRARARGDARRAARAASSTRKEMLAPYVAGDEAKIVAISDSEKADFKQRLHRRRVRPGDGRPAVRPQRVMDPRAREAARRRRRLRRGRGDAPLGKRSVLDLLRQRATR